VATLVAETVRAALAAYVGVEWGKDAVQYKNSISGDTCVLYDLYGNAVTVRAPELLNYTNKLFSTTLPTIAATGTIIAGGVVESQIVTGGETLILTLTNGTWAAAGTAFNALRQAILDGLVSAQAEAAGWNAKRAAFAVTTVVRTSATIVTVTTPATAAYSVTADEVITMTIPANAVVNSAGATVNKAFPAAPTTFTITANS
jgi:hypothetical protein